MDRNDQRILGFHAPLIGGGLIGVPEALQAVHRNVRALHVRVGVHVLRAAQVGVALAAPALVVLRKGDHLFNQNVPAENRRVLFLAEPNLTASRVVQAAFANAPLLAKHPRKAVEKIFLPHPRRFLEIPSCVGGLSDQERGHGNFAAGQIGIAVRGRAAQIVQQFAVDLRAAPCRKGGKHRGMNHREDRRHGRTVAEAEAVYARRVAGEIFHRAHFAQYAGRRVHLEAGVLLLPALGRAEEVRGHAMAFQTFLPTGGMEEGRWFLAAG